MLSAPDQQMVSKKSRLRIWQTPVTPGLDEALEKAVNEDAHVSKSDYIREAVRKKLERDGFLHLKRLVAPSGRG